MDFWAQLQKILHYTLMVLNYLLLIYINLLYLLFIYIKVFTTVIIHFNCLFKIVVFVELIAFKVTMADHIESEYLQWVIILIRCLISLKYYNSICCLLSCC